MPTETRHPFWILLTILLCAASLCAQEPEKIELKMVVPTTFELPTKADDKGLLQFEPFKEEKCVNCAGTKEAGCMLCARLDDNKACPECKGTRKAPCRSCGALGHWPDPRKKVNCPGCYGAGAFRCHVCDGRTWQKVQGSGDKKLKCAACRGVGIYKCGVCSGARVVDSVTFKPSLEDATVAALTKTKDQIDGLLAALEKFQPTGKNTRKEMKELLGILDKGKDLPPIKRSPKFLDEMMDKTYGGSMFDGHEDMEANTMKTWIESTQYYLKHQKRLVELCLVRAEANAKVVGDKKDK
ncbi:MAG: hypothetical protein IPK26_26175 [Planctomycetes bacterium]|nr:hypothetical protein [Planctomycetota bacterium]